jgi:hypothetical protein
MRLAYRFALLDAWRSWRNHAPWAVAGGDVICRGADRQGLTGPRRAAGGSQAQQQLAGGLYVVPFPKLSHTMEKGKLIKWHKAIGDRVNMVRTNAVCGLTHSRHAKHTPKHPRPQKPKRAQVIVWDSRTQGGLVGVNLSQGTSPCLVAEHHTVT